MPAPLSHVSHAASGPYAVVGQELLHYMHGHSHEQSRGQGLCLVGTGAAASLRISRCDMH